MEVADVTELAKHITAVATAALNGEWTPPAKEAKLTEGAGAAGVASPTAKEPNAAEATAETADADAEAAAAAAATATANADGVTDGATDGAGLLAGLSTNEPKIPKIADIEKSFVEAHPEFSKKMVRACLPTQ